jgi:hypothetical protein
MPVALGRKQKKAFMKHSSAENRRNGMKFRRSLPIVLLTFAAFALAGAAQRNEGMRAVEGTVYSASGEKVNGAVVQLKDMKTLQIRSFITREEGKFLFQGIRRSTEYELKARHGDKESRPQVLTIFDDRERATVDLRLER